MNETTKGRNGEYTRGRDGDGLLKHDVTSYFVGKGEIFFAALKMRHDNQMIIQHWMIRLILATLWMSVSLRPVSAADIVLEETDLRRFIGRIDGDSAALNGQSVWLDSLIAGSPAVELKPGSYHFYLYARCITPVDAATPVCRLSLAGDKGVIPPRDVLRWEFGDGTSYTAIDWPVEIASQQTVHFNVDMLVMGKNEFLVDSLGYTGPDGMVRWTNDALTHFVGVEIDDPPAVNHRAWANAHTLAFGPYTPLPAKGRYEAVFRIAIAPDFVSDNIATLDVYSHYGVYNGYTDHKTYAIRGMSTADFPHPGEFTEFSLPFDYDGAAKMEYRLFVYHVKRNAVRLDRITIRRIAE